MSVAIPRRKKMGGEICYRKGFERGPWFEIQEMKNLIIAKEASGEDATRERKILKSWTKYEGYETAGEAYRTLGKSKSGRLK